MHVTRLHQIVHTPTVYVTGRVTRGARVTIGGRRVRVSRGRFARSVRLRHGGNHISVVARKRAMRRAHLSFAITRKYSAAELRAIAAKKAAARAAAILHYKQTAISIPYNQLNKDAEAYKGKIVSYTGKILQIQEEPGVGGFMLLSVTDLGYGVWDDNVWVDYDHPIRSAENDMVTIYGKVKGSKTYETQIGGETYVPRVHARFIDE